MALLQWLLVVVAITTSSAGALAAPPSVVPDGWRLAGASNGTARVFVSPDGSARVRFGHEPARSGGGQIDADRFMHKPEEQVTYQAHGASWFVVSGYRGGEIFYRKGNLACGGSRWNLIEFRYPSGAKREMDATVATVAHNMGAYGRDCG
jgi:hypothetical protein